MKICGIYSIRCTVSGKVYYGQALDIRKRWIAHRSVLRKNKHHSRHLQNAWNKYGEGAFVFAVEFECDVADLDLVEQCYLDSNQGGYNTAICSTSNTRGLKRSLETRTKISASLIGKKHTPEHISKRISPLRGKKLSPEHCAKMSAAITGRIVSPETRAKISAANLGKKLTPEHCAKVSAAQIGKKLTPEHIANGIAGRRRLADKKIEELQVLGDHQSIKRILRMRKYHIDRKLKKTLPQIIKKHQQSLF